MMLKNKIRLLLFTVGLLAVSLAGCTADAEPPAFDFTSTENLSDGPNATVPLQFNNYLGNNENIHPKVLYFKTPWNGYKFWMAYTPYPSGETKAENPCIAVSNDGINWEDVPGLSNPLFDMFEVGYNSDTHLLYREDTGVLECWWRPHDQVAHKVYVCRRTTKDGINWTETEKMLESDGNIKSILSPVIMIRDGKYYLYYSNQTDIVMLTADITDDKPVWSEPEILPIDKGDLSLWHHDIINYDPDLLEFAICAFEPGGSHNTADLYYVTQNLKTGEFSKPVKILGRSSDKSAFDSRSIYRASILRVRGGYMIYYSAIDFSRHRHMALSVGTSPFNLRGYNPVVDDENDITEVAERAFFSVNGRNIKNSASLPFSVWDISGRLIDNSKSGEIEVPGAGMYIVKGLSDAFKIVVK